MRTRLASALESSRGKEGQETAEGSSKKDEEAEWGERDMNLERVRNEGEARHGEAEVRQDMRGGHSPQRVKDE